MGQTGRVPGSLDQEASVRTPALQAALPPPQNWPQIQLPSFRGWGELLEGSVEFTGLSGRVCHGIWRVMGPGLLLRAWASLALESGKKEDGRKVRSGEVHSKRH